MNLLSEKELVESVLRWVREHSLKNGHSHVELSASTDLLAQGILDSFGFLDLVLFIEGLTGRPLDLRDAAPEQFCVVQSLCEIALSPSAELSRRE